MPDHRVSSVRPALRDPGAGWGPPLSRGQALGDRGFASGSRPPNALRGFLPRQFFQPPPDRARCHPGRHCHRGDPSITRGECLRRRDQTTTAFVEKRRHRRKPLTNGFDIDHHHNIWYEKAVVNPYITLSKVDSVISGRALSVQGSLRRSTLISSKWSQADLWIATPRRARRRPADRRSEGGRRYRTVRQPASDLALSPRRRRSSSRPTCEP
jgi:hypothetical protein